MLCADLRKPGVAIPATDLRCTGRVKDGFVPVNQWIFVVHLATARMVKSTIQKNVPNGIYNG